MLILCVTVCLCSVLRPLLSEDRKKEEYKKSSENVEFAVYLGSRHMANLKINWKKCIAKTTTIS